MTDMAADPRRRACACELVTVATPSARLRRGVVTAYRSDPVAIGRVAVQPGSSSTGAVAETTPELTPIRRIADRFDLPLSTLHYWERRGLIRPCRRGGQRCYTPEQLHRIALIRMWQATGLMSLEDIATVLAGSIDGNDWRTTVSGRLTAVEEQIDRLRDAAGYLTHLLTCPRDAPATGCPELRRQVLPPQSEP